MLSVSREPVRYIALGWLGGNSGIDVSQPGGAKHPGPRQRLSLYFHLCNGSPNYSDQEGEKTKLTLCSRLNEITNRLNGPNEPNELNKPNKPNEPTMVRHPDQTLQ